MTILGRIFAVLNFFMALVFLGFAFSAMSLIKDPKTKRSWYEVAEEWRKQAASLEKDLQAREQKIRQMENDHAKETNDLKGKLDEQKNLAEQEREQRIKAEERANLVEDKFKESQTRVQLLTAQLDQKRTENEELNKRNTSLVAELQELMKQTEQERLNRVSAEQARNVLEERVKVLTQENTRLQRELESERTRALDVEPKAGIAVARAPAVDVRGQVLRVGANGLIEISIGGDEGLLRNHTLEVFRLTPNPQYVGRVVVVEVEPHRAVAQFLNRENAKQVKIGDQVASRIFQNQ